MKAVCFYGKEDVRVETVPDPELLNPRDAIVKITATAICGSDLHIYDGYIPTMEKGDVLGHEFMGEVVEVGKGNQRLKLGDRVVVPFTIACGSCYFCKRTCGRSATTAIRMRGWPRSCSGFAGSGLFGYSHMYGGYAGGQAEYVRVPFADVGPIKVPDSSVGRAGPVPVGHLSDRLHGRGELRHQAGRYRRRLGLRPGRSVRDQERAACSAPSASSPSIVSPNGWRWRAVHGQAETLNYEEVDVPDALRELTGGQGPDACIDAVGLEAHGTTLDAWYDLAKTSMYLATDRPTHSARQSMPVAKVAWYRFLASTAAGSTSFRSVPPSRRA